jgi:fructose-1,6-bisphosphatase/inositol monophosphatase family enzyme
MWELKLMAWDVAAGFVIAKEAGVKITALDGVSDAFVPPYNYIIANPELHEKMTKELEPFHIAP